MEEPMVEMIGEGGKRVLVSPYIAKQKRVLRVQGLRPAPEVIPAKPEMPPVKEVKAAKGKTNKAEDADRA